MTFASQMISDLGAELRRNVDDAIYGRGRETVELFGLAMLRELRANNHKGGWMQHPRRWHFREIDYHAAKLKAAIRAGDRPERVLEFAADLANHAMFLAQEEGALTPEIVYRRQSETSFVKPSSGVYRRLLRDPRWVPKGWGGLRNPRTSEAHPEP